jgi:hypothetical protein
MYIHNGCRAIDTVQYMSNLIKIRSTHLLPIFYRCFFGRSCSRSNNPPLTVVSGVSMNTLSQIYISQSEIESTLQNNQSENAFYVSSALRHILYHYLASMSWNSSIKQFWNVSLTKNSVCQYYQLVLESHCRLVYRQLIW